MRKIIRLTERDLTKLVKRVLTERRRDFNEVLEMVESIEQHFDSFFENVLSKRTDEFEKHPDFPLEYIIRFVLSTIKENPNLAERMYNQDYYIFYDTILTRPAHTVSSWLNLYCFMNYEMRLKDPEICKYPEDVDWEIVKKETNKEVNVVNNNNIKLTPPKTPNVKTIRKNTERPKIPDGSGEDYKFDFNRYNINIYSTYEDMLKFMSEFEPYVESLKPKDLICSDEIMRILIILSETLQKKIESLQNKYRYNKSPEKSSTSDTDDEKINDFIKKYGGYSKEIFYDLAKKFADDINIPYQLVTNKYDEKYKKMWSDAIDVGYDETKLNQDSEYIKAKELRKKVNYYINCCDNGRWICDDPPPPPFYPPRDDYDYKYNKITIDYNPTTKGGGPSTTNDKSGSKDREMREQIRRTLRKLS